MEKGQICVIVPLYNSEKYISRCINSIINQSYKNIKIIVIDDCSTDGSADVIKKEFSDSKILYIKNEQNIGVCGCRNNGLQYVDSEYVLFLDSDDWLDLNCLENAMRKFQSDKSIDIVVWEIKTALHNMKICDRYQYSYTNTITNVMALSLLSHTFENEYFLSPLLGCKLFKYSIICENQLQFIDTLYEDDIFSFLAFWYSRKIGLITKSNLYYYQNEISLTHKLSQRHIDDLFVSFKYIYKFVKNTPDINISIYYNYLHKCISALLYRINCYMHDVSEINLYKNLLFEGLYQNINMEEYFKYCNVLKI